MPRGSARGAHRSWSAVKLSFEMTSEFHGSTSAFACIATRDLDTVVRIAAPLNATAPSVRANMPRRSQISDVRSGRLIEGTGTFGHDGGPAVGGQTRYGGGKWG